MQKFWLSSNLFSFFAISLGLTCSPLDHYLLNSNSQLVYRIGTCLITPKTIKKKLGCIRGPAFHLILMRLYDIMLQNIKKLDQIRTHVTQSKIQTIITKQALNRVKALIGKTKTPIQQKKSKVNGNHEAHTKSENLSHPLGYEPCSLGPQSQCATNQATHVAWLL